MRLAIFTPVYDPEGSVGNRFTVAVAQELSQRGHHVNLYFEAAPDDAPDLGIEVTRWPRPPGRMLWWHRHLRAAQWAQQQLRTGAYEGVLSFSTLVPGHVIVPLGGCLSQVASVHQQSVAHRPLQRLRLLGYYQQPHLRRCLKRELTNLHQPSLRAVYAISPAIADWLTGKLSVRPALVRHTSVHPQVPVPGEDSREAGRVSVRRAWGIGLDQPVFAAYSLHPEVDGMDQILTAFARLEGGADAVLMLAGPVPFACQQLAARLGVRQRIRVVGHTRRLHDLLAAADVYVESTRLSPWGETALQALACGIPVVTTAHSGAAPRVLGEPGQPRGIVLRQPGQPQHLAQAMTRALDPTLRQHAAQQAHRLSQGDDIKPFMDDLEAHLAVDVW